MAAFDNLLSKSRETPPLGSPCYIDGDALAYSLAYGAEHTADVMVKLRRYLSSIENHGLTPVCVTTSQYSPKGDRFAVATRAPYQGQRKSGTRPPLLHVALAKVAATTGAITEALLEADDRIAALARLTPGVVHSPDKDLRMIPGWHLTWIGQEYVNVRQFHVVHAGKVYGHAWFWRQMLHGDAADNIPPVRRGFGPSTVELYLDQMNVQDDESAFLAVEQVYREVFGEEQWEVAFLEQAVLLWLRAAVLAGPLDVLEPGRPLGGWSPSVDTTGALLGRIG